MVDLSCYKKINIYFFGNEEQKRDFIKNLIFPYFSAKYLGRYFVTREWNGGPNIEIVFSGNDILKEDIEKSINKYCKDIGLFLSRDEIEKNISIYKKNQQTLLSMEKKRKIEIDSSNHLKVKISSLDMEYYKKLYNSSEHVKLHFESRFILEPCIEKAIYKINNKVDMLFLVMELFRQTMNLFEYGEKYASMMYYSNIAGVFAIAKQYNKYDVFKNNYEKLYNEYDIKNFDYKEKDEEVVTCFKNAWDKIYVNCKKLVKNNVLSEEGYYNLSEQEKQMIYNVSNINSDFHTAFINDEKLHDIVTGDIHLTFRSIVNILYNILPILNITFVEKNFCCYSIVRYIMEKYNTSWEEIFEERSLS